jgi:hypothetical protein
VKESHRFSRRPSLAAEEVNMRIIHRRCAGLDVHKKTISVCIRMRVHSHKIETQEAVFGTFTQDLERLRDWLK